MFYKGVITFAALAIVVPLNAPAYWGIVSSCSTPCDEPRGLYGDLLVCDGPVPYVYSMHIGNGSVFSSFPAPGGPGAWGINDLTRNVLLLSNNRTSWIYKMTENGSVIGSFSCPLPGPAGIGYSGGTRLEVAIPSMNVIAVVNPITGSLLSTIRGPGLKPTACSGWGAKFITDAGTHALYLNRRLVMENIETPTGLWYEVRQGNDTLNYYAMFLVDADTKQIYEVHENVAVVPASLGRVKALFH
jgi:hypothetical protein